MIAQQKCAAFIHKYSVHLFFALCLFAFLIRVYDLSGTPAGMHADEVSSAYNAYSILKTGRDEHGVFLPLYFEAFNDYKHPFFIYSMIPSLFVFGITNFATRFTSVLFGMFGVILLYFIISRLWGKNAALLTALFLAIMPWHLHHSRVAFEVISFSFLFLFGLLCFYKGFERKHWFFFSAIIFGISLYSYGIARLFIPLFLIGMTWIYRAELFTEKYRTTLFLCVFIFLTLSSASYYHSFFGDANARFAVVSIFSRTETPLTMFFLNYFSHFSPDYLFFSGDRQINNHITGWGQLPHYALLLVPLGFLFLWKQRHRREAQMVFLWLLLFPVAASFTYGDLPHAARSFIGAPAFAIVMSLGFISLFHLVDQNALNTLFRARISPLSQKGIFSIFIIIIILILVFETTVFLYSYFVIYKETSADYWLAFAPETVQYMESVRSTYDTVYLSKKGLDLFYISLLYYLQADPAQYQSSGLESFGYLYCDMETCINDSQHNLYVFRGFELTIEGTHTIYYTTNDKIAVKFFG